jgi:hypothetical protein
MYATTGQTLNGYRFTAPANTSVTAVWFMAYGHLPPGTPSRVPVFAVEGFSGGAWTTLAGARSNISGANADWGDAWDGGSITPASSVRFGVRCELGACDSSNPPQVDVRSVLLTLDDSSAPRLDAPTGSLVNNTPAQGTAVLGVHTTDQGGGVYRMTVAVGGQSVYDQIPNSNGGKCTLLGAPRRVEFRVPCSLDEAKSLSVDTTTLSDGAQDVVVSAEDIAGNVQTVTKSIVVDNRPPVAGAVSVTGVAMENQALTAEVAGFSGQGVAYDYRWQRCNADGTGCVDIGGADQRTYRLTASDVGKRVRSKVLASDHGGTTVAYSDVMSGTGAHGIVANDPSNDGAGGSGGAGGAGGTGGAGGAGGPGGSGSGVALPNGDNPSRLAKVTAVVDRKGKTITKAYGKVVTITGKLLDERGRAIRNAVVEVQAVRKVPRAVPVLEGKARTDAKGRFSYRAKASASRELRFTYRAYSTDRDLTSKASVVLLTRAAGTFAATPRGLRNGHTVTFSGRLKGGLVPKGGVAVEVQVRYCLRTGGKLRCEWRLVRSVRASRRGAFKARYTFRRTTATTTYAFRAKARPDSAWPFVGGTLGRTAAVTVRP